MAVALLTVYTVPVLYAMIQERRVKRGIFAGDEQRHQAVIE